MSDDQLEIQRLCGELELLCRERDWWAEEMIFWRSKYMRDHPEHANSDYAQTAREEEGNGDGMIFI